MLKIETSNLITIQLSIHLKHRNMQRNSEGKNNRKKWFFSPDARQGTLMRLRRMRRLLWLI